MGESNSDVKFDDDDDALNRDAADDGADVVRCVGRCTERKGVVVVVVDDDGNKEDDMRGSEDHDLEMRGDRDKEAVVNVLCAGRDRPDARDDDMFHDPKEDIRVFFK